jgi:2-keto-4-pentenoate hydratase/2-oxohepta-3-ene-1,7-dioic acid hydratase in catechol pathway
LIHIFRKQPLFQNVLGEKSAMKLVSYIESDEVRLGVYKDKIIIDISEASKVYTKAVEGKSAKIFDFPNNMKEFLEGGENLWNLLYKTVDWFINNKESIALASITKPVSVVRLTAPIPNPGKIVCVGLNYLDHCLEQKIDVPKSPVLFAKFPSSVIGNQESITWPEGLTDQVDYEAELAIVIGKQARNVSISQAYEYIAGYTIINDVSARDIQFSDGQWVRGKSLDTFCPMGPWLVTPDEVVDPHNLSVRCWVNEVLLQDSNTKMMIFKIPDLISFISRSFTLYPGDVISTGTPHGVGVFRNPPIFLNPGDVVRLSVEGLGDLCNPVV